MDCWGAMRATTFSPMRDRCMEIAERYQLRPLHVTTLDTIGYSYAVYAIGPYQIGFFEVTGMRAGGDAVPSGEGKSPRPSGTWSGQTQIDRSDENYMLTPIELEAQLLSSIAPGIGRG